MKTSLKGISVIESFHRSWKGVVADVWQVRCEDAEGAYESPDPRLFVALQVRGNGSLVLDGAGTRNVDAQTISYVPAGKFLRSFSRGTMYVQHLDLHFDLAALRRQFGSSIDEQRLNETNLVFQDQQLLAICQLIAAECRNSKPLPDMYGDGLMLALSAKLFGFKEPERRRRSKLSDRQLRLAKDYMTANDQRAVRLSELAELTELSESQFSHAFKATVGVSPHKWHQEIRIKKAQELLVAGDRSLAQVAEMAGFADQAHFTRMFKRITGLPPALWASQRLAPKISR
ncbi:AraC family transcriptional regulator [Hyphomicrobium sp.]|uniref:AraC family transcriptional regulator n=1 Tax=Hyphomicrobium sp. TaxID=82 RepID=UPI002D78047A|nr:AraC family transcriptional regulator [Hyphomicrobium sp.]HET6389584.1 AraC family transcriptional regulator [Hyphomicrobium sp.]